MKCALEIIAIKEEAEKAYALEQARLDEECRVKHAEIIAATFTLCEEVIGVELEKCAMARRNPYFSLKGVIKEDRVGNKIFHPLYEESHRYANGDKSYCCDTSVSYDANALTTYLSNFCYSVHWEEITYQRYGFGSNHGERFTVTIE